MPKGNLLGEKSKGRTCFRNVLIQVLKQPGQAAASLHVSASLMRVLILRLLVGAKCLPASLGPLPEGQPQQDRELLLHQQNGSPGPDSLGEVWATDPFLNQFQWLGGC